MGITTSSDEHCSLSCQFLKVNMDFSDDARCVLFDEPLYGSLMGDDTDPCWRRVPSCIKQEKKAT